MSKGVNFRTPLGGRELPRSAGGALPQRASIWKLPASPMGEVTVVLTEQVDGETWNAMVVASTDPRYPVGGYDIRLWHDYIVNGERVDLERLA
jgi:hypothetical protein